MIDFIINIFLSVWLIIYFILDQIQDKKIKEILIIQNIRIDLLKSEIEQLKECNYDNS